MTKLKQLFAVVVFTSLASTAACGVDQSDRPEDETEILTDDGALPDAISFEGPAKREHDLDLAAHLAELHQEYVACKEDARVPCGAKTNDPAAVKAER